MPNGKLPQNLPVGRRDLPKDEPEQIVPERPIFPQKASEKLPHSIQIGRFGEPSDVVPKELTKNPSENIHLAAEKPEKDSVPFMPEGDLSPEKIARREMIKKTLIFIILILLIIFGVGLTVNRLLLSKKKTPAVKSSPIFSLSPTTSSSPKIDETQDSDGDGMPDLWEMEHKLNPHSPQDAKEDPDLDKLLNLEEYKYQTDPQNPDSDGDSYKDGEEVKNGYNPKGPGKLSEEINKKNDDNNAALSRSRIEGKWQGTMLGVFYNIHDLNLDLDPQGKITGKFTTLYQQYKIQNEISGTYSFKKESNIFSAKLSGSAIFLGRIRGVPGEGLFSLTFDGVKRDNEINGTWVFTPQDLNLFWLKGDRGNFTIKWQGL